MGGGSSTRLRRLAAWAFLVRVIAKVVGLHRNQARTQQNTVTTQQLQTSRDSGQWREQRGAWGGRGARLVPRFGPRDRKTLRECLTMLARGMPVGRVVKALAARISTCC